jgi:hypothetical protein
VILDGLMTPVGPEGEIDTDREIVPAKLLRLVTLIVEVPQVPWSIVMLPGLAEVEKLGAVTVTEMVATCDKVPLVPVTDML